jgi:hypothetical protein
LKAFFFARALMEEGQGVVEGHANAARGRLAGPVYCDGDTVGQRMRGNGWEWVVFFFFFVVVVVSSTAGLKGVLKD